MSSQFDRLQRVNRSGGWSKRKYSMKFSPVMRTTSGSFLCLRHQLNASALLPHERTGAAQAGLVHFVSITAPCSKEGAALQRGRPVMANDPAYAATATLWKVEVTASNV